MIKDGLNKMFSIVMALTVLVSTMSFTVEKHYCGTTLVDTAIFTKVHGCGMIMDKLQSTQNKQNTCCKDEVEVIKGQDKLKIASFEDLKFYQQLFFTSFVYSYLNLFEGLEQQIIPHKNYSPPNLVANIQVLDQVFII